MKKILDLLTQAQAELTKVENVTAFSQGALTRIKGAIDHVNWHAEAVAKLPAPKTETPASKL